MLVSVGLAMDAFAVSLGVGTDPGNGTRRAIARMAFHFGLFQGLMAFIGWLAGSTISHLISSVDHWVGFALLAWVGVRMMRSGLNPNSDTGCSNPTRGGTLVVLCVATSLDALAVGLSFAVMAVNIVLTSLAIGIITFALSLAGGAGGSALGVKFGKRMEVVGGIILIAIGLRILVTHLFPFPATLQIY